MESRRTNTKSFGAAAAGLLVLATAALTGCPPPDTTPTDSGTDVAPDTNTGVDAGIDVPQSPDVPGTDAADAPATDAPTADVPTPTCPANPPVTEVRGNITADTSWDCNHTYVLADNTPIFVTSPAVLRIGAGTVIRGAAPRAALIVSRGARLEATGTASAPVVFTSNQPVGMRRSGDWAGVALLGGASINEGRTAPPVPGQNLLEGLMASEEAVGVYGGGASPDDNFNCGTLRYVRIEFAGNELSPNNELNGLTVAGCGRATTLDYIQVHLAADDAVEFFGGTADIRHFVATQPEDDGLDWDQGWRGRAQFIAIQGVRTSTEADPSGIEADNDRNVNTAMPVASPTIYNITIQGPGADTVTTRQMRGIVLRRGTGARFYNLLLTGYPTGGIDVRDAATIANTMGATPLLAFANSIVSLNGPSGTGNFTDAESDSAPDNFDEAAWFTGGAGNRVGTEIQLPAYNTATPDFTPPAGSAATMNAATPGGDAFFDASAVYLGAVPPGASTIWTTGWTSYPAN